ncbi:MAG: hypothetical protein IPJ77_16925 [Planctomycetes bacterium]|nr:hypothetical protein [Planctomycetota bacterium]
MKSHTVRRSKPGRLFLLALGLLSTRPIYAALQGPEVPASAPASLKTVTVPMPSNLLDVVEDLDAAKRLGKSLFWDMQVGSDGKTACASCHFQSGADSRVKNQVNPGPQDLFGTFFSGGGGPNYTPLACDFPFHRLAVPDENDSEVLHDVDDRFSSAGVFRRTFDSVNLGNAEDSGTIQADPNGFSVGGVNVRRVEPRNTPTVINSIFLHRMFWDGRANHFFNGVNPFGDTDPNARVLINDGNDGDVALPVHLLFDHAAAASQSVGPPLSPFEMSYDGRQFAELGRKMLSLRPLALQRVASNDSVLGGLSALPGTGLTTPTYEDLIEAAFKERTWNGGGTYDGFTHMEKNFSLFFGLSILAYESTLVSDDSRYDQYQDGGGEGGTSSNALTPQEKEGLDIFLNRGSCIECHSGPEFAGATMTDIQTEGLLERMLMADGEAEGNVTFVTYPPPVGEPLHPDDRPMSFDPRGKLVEIRPPTGYGSPLAWGWAYFSTGNGACNPPIDETIVLTPGANAPANSSFTAEMRLRVDSDCSKTFRVDMGWQYPGGPSGDYTVYVGGRLMGRIHMGGVNGPAVYDNGFYNIGVRPTAEDLGNGGSGPFGPFAFAARARNGQNVDGGALQPPVGANERIAVNGAFKTPSLRNIELTGPYMHNGGFATLEQVVDFYTGGAHFEELNKPDLDPEVGGIGGMSPERKAALVAFLKALTDERVRFERAPFDHPELILPHGHAGDEQGTTAGPNCNGLVCEAVEESLVLPAVGADGRGPGDDVRPFEDQLDPCVNLLAYSNQQVTETGGAFAQVRVSLSHRPAQSVVVPITVSDATEGTVTSGATLTFTPTNWSTPQLVVVRGVQDGVVDGNVSFQVRAGSVTSTDPDFTGIDGNHITITTTDSGVRYETFSFEAENGALTSPMVQVVDSSASNARYVTVPNGTGNNTSTTGTSGSTAFTFNVTAPGNYYVWALVKGPSSTDNQFWARMDNGTSHNWSLPVTSVWTWDKVNNSGAQDPVLWNLTSGNHTLRIRWREDGARLDRVIVTSDPAYVPQTGNPIAP